jgi:hypothetical protein
LAIEIKEKTYKVWGMPHNIPQRLVDTLIADISDAKRTQVAVLQQYIQELLGSTHHTFLQGSYRNRTAISDIPDVDIVAIRTNIYSYTYSPFRFDISYPWHQIFSEVKVILQRQSRYVWMLEEKAKCIKIRGEFNADIVPAVKVGHDHQVDPIVIRDNWNDVERISYPRQHIDNGTAKHAATGQQFKPTVRMFKKLVKNHFGDANPISSFQVEALVYSVPNESFSNDPVITFLNVATSIQQRISPWILPAAPIYSVCGSENILLNWNPADRTRFSNKLDESLLLAFAAYRAKAGVEAEKNWRLAFNM